MVRVRVLRLANIDDLGEPDTEAVGYKPRPVLEAQPPTLGVECC